MMSRPCTLTDFDCYCCLCVVWLKSRVPLGPTLPVTSAYGDKPKLFPVKSTLSDTLWSIVFRFYFLLSFMIKYWFCELTFKMLCLFQLLCLSAHKLFMEAVIMYSY